MRRGSALQILAAMAMMGASAGIDQEIAPWGSKYKPPREPKRNMPLTEEEEEKLASLSGKEKKKFVRELKEKYK